MSLLHFKFMESTVQEIIGVFHIEIRIHIHAWVITLCVYNIIHQSGIKGYGCCTERYAGYTGT